MIQDFSIIAKVSNYKLNIDVLIEDDIWNEYHLKDTILQTTKAVLNYLHIYKYADNIEFSIILTNNIAIQSLNKQYRFQDKPTNTLSFPAQDINPKEMKKNKFHDGFAMLGDVIFAYQIIEDEAKEQNKDFKQHFTHLLAHGLLHLFGFDHKVDSEAEEMENIEIELLNKMGIQSPYEK